MLKIYKKNLNLLVFNKDRIESASKIEIRTYEEANSLIFLNCKPPSITQNTADVKKQTGANNYTSFATYYHPDPNTPTGFPYVRKDGFRNGEIEKISDRPYLNSLHYYLLRFCTLYALTNSEKYAEKSIEIIRKFFIDENTKMNPDLTYSGIVIGNSMDDLKIRGAIIDTSILCRLPDFLELIKSSQSWSKEIEDGMVSWFDSLSNWLKTHPRGIRQSGYSHNIKTAYVNQLCSYLYFCGKQSEAKSYLENNVRDLLSAQIDSEGKQPLEMDRVKSRHYSSFNLTLLVRMAKISNSLGVNVWNYEDENGRGSIRKAMKYLCQCYENPQEWTASNEENDPSITKHFLRDGVILYDDSIIHDVYKKVDLYDRHTHLHEYLCLPSAT